MSNFDRNAPVWGAGRAQQTSAVEMDQGLRSFMLGVYNNMSIGLAITGLAAIGISMLAIAGVSPTGKVTALTGLGQALYLSPLKWVVMLAPLAFVFFFTFRIQTMSTATAQITFWAFCAVMGLSLASVFLVFTGASIARTFFIAATMFGATSLYGYVTKRDLAQFGSFLMMGLIGVMIASVVNIFLGSSMLQFAVSVIGIVVFVGLTAWDTQNIKQQYSENVDQESQQKMAVFGALSLFLNFVNIFQLLLNFTGERE